MRVLTWNLWWRFGDWRARQAAISDVLAVAQPDLVGLQEVRLGGGTDQAHQLAARLGLHCAVAPAPDARRWHSRTDEAGAGGGVGVGNAVLSRWPITTAGVVDLPQAPGHGVERTLLVTLVAAPTGPVTFCTTHLHSDLDGSGVRLAQAAVIADRLHGPQDDDDAVVVLTGDLNAEAGSPEVQRLLRTPGGGPPGRSFLDAWMRAGPEGDAGWTWDARNPHAAVHGPETARVDHVLVSPTCEGRGRPLRARVVGDRPVDGVWPSDHSAVVVDLGG